MSGKEELVRAGAANRGLFLAVALFSLFVNALMLTGPLFMLQVYDRVLNSGSLETLVVLTAIAAFLYLMMGILDAIRGRVLARAAQRFHQALAQRVFSASIRHGPTGPQPKAAGTALGDLDAIKRSIASPAKGAMFDLPFTPLFGLAIFLFHPALGLTALIGGSVLIALTLANRVLTNRSRKHTKHASEDARAWAEQITTHGDTIQALGMREQSFDRWHNLQLVAAKAGLKVSDRTDGFSVAAKTWRMFLQSLMLAVGAWLVLLDALSPGAMIASSILLGRALAPIETLIAQWAVMDGAIRGRRSLSRLLSAVPASTPKTPLPRPVAALEVRELTIVPPGQAQASLRLLSFQIRPGQALGVIGPSGAGKTTLARALTGLWPVAGGHIRLDQARIDQYPPDTLGQLIGYLPQNVHLFHGTIAENIARMDPDACPKAIVAAARRADAHGLILSLPQGYDTNVTALGHGLSGGQVQRIGLARALYGDPVLIILDEPNANLDNEGSEALNRAIRQMKAAGCAVLIMAHRPAAIQECDQLLMLSDGIRKAIGSKERVLREVVCNHQDLVTPLKGGVA